MGKFTGVLLASDFDDTLYNSDRQVSKRNLEALEYFTREGGYFTVSTGRAHRTFTPYVHLAPVNAPVILSNGASLYDYAADELVCEWPLPLTAAADLAALSEAMPSLGIEVYHGDELYIHRPNEYTARHVAKVGTDWTERHLLDAPTPWSKSVIQDCYESLLEAQKFMLSRWDAQYEVIFSNSVLLECTAKGSNKGGTVLKLAEMLGVERKDLYCVGDNQNDIPMLLVSAIPFAPANCADAVREISPRLVRSCDEDGIAEVIDILDEMY